MRKLFIALALTSFIASPTFADNKAIAVDEMAGYLEFVDYGGATIFPEQIPAEEYKKMMVIDARDKAQFDKSHIPGAVNIEWRQVLAQKDKIPKNKPVLIYCNTGSLSAQAGFALRVAGYENLRILQGGYEEWKSKGGMDAYKKAVNKQPKHQQMNKKDHWEKVYGDKAPDAVSWYAPHLETSLNLIHQASTNKSAALIDIGGGESTLVDDLLSEGYEDISVLDISQKAIDVARDRIGKQADKVHWYCADITQATLPQGYFDVWHDRAVFHFLTEEADRAKYVAQVMRSVKHGGYVIMSTFGPEGPEKCSGLDVVRYDSENLHGQFGKTFKLIDSSTELHQTPMGTTQQFLYCFCRME